uniref:Uncharacterized protein n=1 Tax=Anopheles minimus TaxID=112268 RepID=A0A182WP23_9DIPT
MCQGAKVTIIFQQSGRM